MRIGYPLNYKYRQNYPLLLGGGFPLDDFLNDDFEGYATDTHLKDKNGGYDGAVVKWQSDYRVYGYGPGAEEGVTSVDGVLNLEQWVNADSIAGVDHNEALDTWEDKTVNNLDFTATGAQRPTYQTNVQNGLPGVLFNATSGVGMTGTLNKGSGDFSIIVVYRSNDLANVTARRVVQGANNWLIGPYAGYNRIYNGGFLQASYPTIAPVVMAIVQTGTTDFRGYLNAVLFGIRTSGLGHPGLIHFGATGFANEPAQCHLFEYAAYSRALTAAEIYAVTWGLMFKWGMAPASMIGTEIS